MPEFPGRFRPPRLASAPASPANGEVYFDTALVKFLWWNGAAWIDPTATKTLRIGHTWAVAGTLQAATLPAIFVPEAGSQGATLVGLRTVIGSGTSAGVQVTRNGSNLGSVVTVTTTPATTTYSQAITDGDRLAIVLSALTGSPADLSVTAIVEHVI